MISLFKSSKIFIGLGLDDMFSRIQFKRGIVDLIMFPIPLR